MEDCTFVRQCAPNQQKKLNKEMKHRSLTELERVLPELLKNSQI